MLINALSAIDRKQHQDDLKASVKNLIGNLRDQLDKINLILLNGDNAMEEEHIVAILKETKTMVKTGIRTFKDPKVPRNSEIDRLLSSLFAKSRGLEALLLGKKMGAPEDGQMGGNLEGMMAATEGDNGNNGKEMPFSSPISPQKVVSAKKAPSAKSIHSFKRDGKTYGTIAYFAELLGLNSNTIGLVVVALLAHEGDKKGKFYCEEEVISACKEMGHIGLPVANKKGFFVLKEATYGIIAAWQSKLGISDSMIKSRLKEIRAVPVPCKDKCGHKTDAYSEEDVKKACADLLAKLPLLLEDLTVDVNGLKYVTQTYIVKVFGIEREAVLPLLANILPIDVKTSSNVTTKAYLLSAVQKAIADWRATMGGRWQKSPVRKRVRF